MIPKGTLGAPCTEEQVRQQRSHTPYFYSKKIPRHMMLWQRNERMTTNMELPQGTPLILKKTWLFPFGRTFLLLMTPMTTLLGGQDLQISGDWRHHSYLLY